MKTLFIILCLILLPALVDAAQLYVDPACSNGSAYNPATHSCSGGSTVVRQTIVGGVTAMSGGDELIIRPGTYVELLRTGHTVVPPDGTPSARTIVRAETNGTVIMMPSSSCGDYGIFEAGALNLTVRGLILDGANTSTINNWAAAINNTDGNTVIFEDNEVRNNPQTGAFVTNNAIVRRNIFHNNGGNSNGGLEHGIYLTGHNNLLQRNEFYQNCAYGAQDFTASNTTANNIWEYNIFHDNRQIGALTGGGFVRFVGRCADNGGGLILYGTNNIARFNIAYSNQGNGGIGMGDCLNCFLYNNTAYGNQGAGIGINGRNPTVKNNVGSATSASDDSSPGHDLHQEPAATGVTMSNNACATSDGLSVACSISANPQFTDTSNQDFSLLSSSPLINSGVNVGLPFNDTLPEIGAFEIATPISATTVDASNVDVFVGSAFAPFTSPPPTCSNFVLKQNAATKTLTGCSTSGNASFRVTCAACLTAGGGNITITYTSSATLTDSILIGNSKNQRLLSFGDFPVTNTISGTTAVFTAKHFRCRVWNLNTTVNTAQSWYTPEDSACSVQTSNGKIAIIVAVDCTGADCNATGFKWEYQTNGIGGWTEIDNSCVTNSVCYDNTQTGGASHGASITPTLLTNPQSTYVTGWVQAQNSSFNSIDLSLNSATNIMASLAIQNGLTAGTVLAVRPKQDNGVAITHNVTASFTLANAAQGLP